MKPIDCNVHGVVEYNNNYMCIACKAVYNKKQVFILAIDGLGCKCGQEMILEGHDSGKPTFKEMCPACYSEAKKEERESSENLVDKNGMLLKREHL